MAGLPTGAMSGDTGEYLMGDVVVTVVLLESTPTLAPHDPSTENWTPSSIQAVKTKVADSLAWWKSLATIVSPTMGADLNFYVNYQYADSPVQTGYEPISRISNDFQFWIYSFLNQVGFNQTGDHSTDIRAFNHAQRSRANATPEGPADWAFTVFVVNSAADGDDAFAPGGSFSRAFAFAGGRMAIIPSDRPVHTFAHEMGHMFWAMDEYSGNSPLSERGYYSSPNSNAARNGYVQQPSLMASGTALETAWAFPALQTASTLEVIGWRDSDGDGIFDALDVPFDLTGAGQYDEATGRYQFRGSSAVRTLPNRNPVSLQNDITINEISRAEYRIDGGAWQTAAEYGEPTALLNLDFAVPPSATTVEIRTIDAGTGASSPVFTGRLSRPDAAVRPGINGFVWNDEDGDGQFDADEPGLPGWTVQLVGAGGQLLNSQSTYEPDGFSAGTILNSARPGVTLTALGNSTDGSVSTAASTLASTGSRVFAAYDTNLETWNASWAGDTRRLRARFSTAVSRVSIDAIGDSAADYARMEAYDADDQLIARATSRLLTTGARETLTIERSEADIAYVIVRGHVGSQVLLDNLQYGAEATARTGPYGEYVLDALPAGTYTVRAVPPSTFLASGPLPAEQVIVVATSQTATGVDFAAQGDANPWQNAFEPMDVNDDDFISPVDALLVINSLNADGSRELTAGGGGSPYLDVNGDGFVSPIDALMVINWLNAASAAEAPDSAGSAGAGSTGGSVGGAVNGEELAIWGVAASAANSALVSTTGSASQVAASTVGTASSGSVDSSEPSRSAVAGWRRFVARDRATGSVNAAASDAPSEDPPSGNLVSLGLPDSSDSSDSSDLDDALAIDVYQAWVRSLDAAVDDEAAHSHGPCCGCDSCQGV